MATSWVGLAGRDSSCRGRNKFDGSHTSEPASKSDLELSGAGRCADLYSAFSVQRNLWDLGDEKPMQVFSAADSSRDSAGNAAKCHVFGAASSYFSDINDLMADRDGFEPPVRFCNAKSRRSVSCRQRKCYERISTARMRSEHPKGPVSLRLPFVCKGEE